MVVDPAQVSLPQSVTIGCVDAPVKWVGLISPGLFQLNVRISHCCHRGPANRNCHQWISGCSSSFSSAFRKLTRDPSIRSMDCAAEDTDLVISLTSHAADGSHLDV
jgi:hypothetical protein